ncbi:hypothetical protein V491_01580 [Pseudogymnoascus sp. VKM F-3775]|nr:hypothetical protein V491_01580 [Pseudogymnoascus sp. VKM F-3775]
MDDKELATLSTGYGYQPRFVEDLEDINRDLAASMQWAIDEIRSIQKAARSGKPIYKPHWPVLIMRTPKGWSGPKVVDGQFVEGSFHSHQVPLMKTKTDDGQLKDLQTWLLSYDPKTLFQDNGDIVDLIREILLLKEEKKLGQRVETYNLHEKLKVPDWKQFSVDVGSELSCMKTIARFIDQALVDNPHVLGVFSPDELERYTLTGGTAILPSYESFLGIIHTMMVQYSKFNKMARETNWRTNISSINYIETSTWTRQEHNGFSHQNPSFIGAVLNLKPHTARVYLPPDANTFLSTLAHCLRSVNYVNLMVGAKHPVPVFLSVDEADRHCQAGASIWKFASTDNGLNPDVVLVGIGCEVMFEVVAAASVLRRRCPALRVRVINVTDLMILESETLHPHALTRQDFETLFTADKPIHFNYHGYINEIKGLLFGRPNLERELRE